jgi:type IV secretory pathway VirB10-like protein
MSANNPLVAGVILIVIGVAFALLAYALLMGRKSENRRPAEPESADPQEKEPFAEAAVVKPVLPPVPFAAPAPTIAQAPLPQTPSTFTPGPPASPPVVPPPAVVTGIPSAPPSIPGARLIPGALLLRDEVTGKLVVQVGQQQYASPAELKASKDWLRVERLASDLASWAVPSAPEKAALTGLAGPAGLAGREEPAPRPASMIEQINVIFERKLLASGAGRRGIRLTTGPDGGVRVMIGIQAFSLDQVPDPEVSRMIRESVAEWEKQG